MDVEDIALFLSIKPRFAASILDGTKTVELRRVSPAVQQGFLVLLYASSPQRELVGTCRVADLEVDSIDAIWDRHGDRTGVTQAEYGRYFDGARRAVAIVLSDPSRLPQPRSLKDLRGSLGGFQPPQSFRYFDAATVNELDLLE